MQVMVLRMLVMALVVSSTMLALPARAAVSFAGDWSGTWTDVEIGQNGRVALRIGEDGAVQGTVSNDGQNLVGPISGRATEDGHIRVTYTYDGGQTRYVGDGTLLHKGDRLTGGLDFLLPNGQRLGRGEFEMNRAE